MNINFLLNTFNIEITNQDSEPQGPPHKKRLIERQDKQDDTYRVALFWSARAFKRLSQLLLKKARFEFDKKKG